MTTYRRFQVDHTASHTVITEITSTDRHPMNWSDIPQSYTREGAWRSAQSVHLPATLVTLDGTVREFTADEVFNPEALEALMYSGYVGYGYSMSDGYYAPIKFDAWVHHFRKSVLSAKDDDDLRNLGYGNDASQHVHASLPRYRELLVRATQSA